MPGMLSDPLVSQSLRPFRSVWLVSPVWVCLYVCVCGEERVGVSPERMGVQ